VADFAAIKHRLTAALPVQTLAVAESLTSGGLQVRIGRIFGASEFFRGGITAYTLEQKVRHLKVNRAAARKVDCVSQTVAEQMARGACRLFGSDWGLATTGYAEPNASTATPYAYWAIARKRKIVASGRVDCPGCKRAAAQDRVSDAVLRLFLREL
jgi:nicotinamide-nucleotide amidase